MKKIIVASILCLTSCAEDDRVGCEELDGGITAAEAPELSTHTDVITFPDLLVHFER